jgi:hypothetical protein
MIRGKSLGSFFSWDPRGKKAGRIKHRRKNGEGRIFEGRGDGHIVDRLFLI